MKKSLNVLTLTVGASLAAMVPAQAQTIASENFNYPTGSEVLSQGSAGNGWANVWADKNNLDTVVSGSLTYSDGSGNTLATSGNSLQSNGAASPGSASSEPERTLASTIGVTALANTADPNTVWMSYLWLGGNTSSGPNYRQATMMFLKGASTTSTSPGGTEYMDVGMPNIMATNSATVLPNISLWSSSGNSGQTLTSLVPLQSTVAANSGSAAFILIEMTGTATAWGAVGNSETMNIWINPTLTQAAPIGAPNISYSGQDLSTINAIRAQSGGFNATYGTLPGEETVADINFGDTPADVEPLATPEPASLSLMALGGLALAACKRKQS